jgi:hypothetical protein
MLLFLDQQGKVKILRSTPDKSGKSRRTRVGTISKTSLTRNLARSAQLSQQEEVEVQSALEVMRRAQAVRRHAYALEFPQIAREVMDYFENGATRMERELISSAVLEAMRRMRRTGKVAA